MKDIKQKLKNIFGYNFFRPLQEEIIQTILSKKDVLVVMPTGGGKSLCYQIPSLFIDGLTIVISPLISLMKDQVEQLNQIGIEAVVLNSSLSPEDYAYNYERVRSKKVKLLYIAPESLNKNDVQFLFKAAELKFITVDEAHCISEWGHDFRKDYRQIGALRNNFPQAVCAGFTATATPRVQDDIIKNLNLVDSKNFVAGFDRPNLFLQVEPKYDAYSQTIKFLNEHKNQSGIIYCFSRKQVDELHEDLSRAGFSTKPYHAGMPDDERKLNQDLFSKDKIDIIIATIAFGMGINKSNVRFVIHYDLPKNLESYYQEIGRAGRDGVKSDCLLLFSHSDTAKINYFINQKEDEKERLSARVHLDAMVRYAEYDGCRRKPLISYFGEQYNKANCGMCDNCLDEIKESDDITIAAQKFLSAVKRTGEIFGAAYVIDVLEGSAQEKILKNGHQNLSVYGIGREYSKLQWKKIVSILVNKNYLFRDVEFGSLKTTPQAENVLFKNEKVFGRIEEKEFLSKKVKAADNYDEELFEELRQKRRQIAEARNVPPYVIFSDRSLIEVASKLPQTENELLNISGIGERKVKSYGPVILTIVKSYCIRKKIAVKENNLPKVKKTDNRRFNKIGEAFNQNNSIDEIADTLNVKRETVIRHLLDYVINENKLDTQNLKKEIKIDKGLADKIYNEFELNGSERLAPVKEKYGEEVSYNDLHLLRVFYINSKL